MPYQTIFLGRYPPPKDLLGRTFYALGSFLRATGGALDAVGTAVQGGYAGKDALTPNLAWSPFLASKGITPPKGVAAVPWPKNPLLQDSPKVDIVLPVKGDGVFVAQNATLTGHVSIGDFSSIWYGAVLRGDINSISIGNRTNVQDNVVVHVSGGNALSPPRATNIGSNCTIGHGATIHACSVGDGCLVGMGATLLDGVTLEPGSIVAAGAVVPPGSVVRTGQIWAGSPAKLLRTLTAEEAAFVSGSADNYAKLALAHKIEAEKAFEEVYLDRRVAEERSWRQPTDIDVHQGILRDPETQAIISMR